MFLFAFGLGLEDGHVPCISAKKCTAIGMYAMTPTYSRRGIGSMLGLPEVSTICPLPNPTGLTVRPSNQRGSVGFWYSGLADVLLVLYLHLLGTA